MLRFLLVLIFLLPPAARVFSQPCTSDSIVTVFYHKEDYPDFNYIRTDTFDVVNGIKRSSERIGDDSLVGDPVLSQSFFTRRYLQLNVNKDTAAFFLFNGTGSGYSNYKRIEYTYDSSSHNILSRHEYSGIGSNWNLIKEELRTYDANHNILSYIRNQDMGFGLQNQEQHIYTYQSGLLQEVTIQFWNGSSWKNEFNYIYQYDNGVKDSLQLQVWDDSLPGWSDSLLLQFDPLNNYRASFGYTTTDSVGNTRDSSYYELDTLRNTMYYYTMVNYDTINRQSFQIVGNYFRKQGSTYTNNYGCINYHTLLYDTNGVMIGSMGGSHCAMPTSNSSNITYDANYRMIAFHSEYSSNVDDNDKDSTFYYPGSNSIFLDYVDQDDMEIQFCIGDYFKPAVLVGGGCGSYQFAWTPSTGLSDDSIAEPLILVNDSITYTVRVTDTTGHMAITSITVEPTFVPGISISTPLCMGCPVWLRTNPFGIQSYQWYFNGNPIPNSNNDSLFADSSGTYFVEVTLTTGCMGRSGSIQVFLYDPTRITGQLYMDIDSNCALTASDIPVNQVGTSPFFIRVQKQGYILDIMPDTNGVFNIRVDTGTYQLSVVNQVSTFDVTCPPTGSYTVNVPNHGDTISGNDFGLTVLHDCQLMKIVVSGGLLRPCLPATIRIDYYNEGAVNVPVPEILAYLPPELLVTGASLPFTLVPGNGLRFLPGALNVGASGTILITVDVDCAPAQLTNATLCVDAEIKPLDLCVLEADTTWDGNLIRVEAFCQNDSLACFDIMNAGVMGSMMASPLPWRLYDDNILIQQGTFQLAAGIDTTICITSNGSTYRLEADQSTSFPINSLPRASIERCGILGAGGLYSLGYILTSGHDNTLPFYYTYCDRILNSFDPNDKRVQPSGYGTGNFIRNSDMLTYHIGFQNTGNDTAFNVQVVDTLDLGVFDISSLNILSSSHTGIFELRAPNILTWTFTQILLPDSNVNEPASHGYVEFSINTTPQLPVGTEIFNTGYAFFDFNSPVATPTTFNTICEPLEAAVTIFALTSNCSGDSATYTVIPTNGGNAPLYSWYLNGSFMMNGQDTMAFIGLNSGDSIHCVMHSSYLCPLQASVVSNKILFGQAALATISFVSPYLVSSPATSYQWYRNQQLLPGEINQTLMPVLGGEYTVEIMDSMGCTSVSAPFVYIHPHIPEKQNARIRIYPNPADDQINIEGVAPGSTYAICDVMGRNISEGIITKDLFPLSVKNLPNGIYLIRASSDYETFSTLLTIVR